MRKRPPVTTVYHILSGKGLAPSGSDAVHMAGAASSENNKIRLVLLADLHDRVFGSGNRLLFDAIEACEPDAVLLAGDIFSARLRRGNMRTVGFLKELIRSYPVFMSLGNHEKMLLGERYDNSPALIDAVAKLKEEGLFVLDDETALLTVRGRDIAVTGLSLPLSCYKRRGAARFSAGQIEEAVGRADPDRYQILLAHTPVYEEAYTAWGADLTLCGHIHGGIVRFGRVGLITPQLQFFYGRSHGAFSLGDDRKMIVTSGLGLHSIPIRIMNPPEIVQIIIEGRSKQ